MLRRMVLVPLTSMNLGSIRRSSLRSIVVLVVLGFYGTGCSRDATVKTESLPDQVSRADTRSVSKASALSSIPGSSYERYLTPFKQDLDREDPTADGWNTEAFSESAMSQLKALAHLIESQATVAENQMAGFVSDGFECGPLRPSDLKTVFDDSPLEVRRFDSTASENRSELFQSAAGLAKAVNQLRAGIGDNDLHVHFKLVRVELAENGAQTVAYYQLGGRCQEGAIQQSGVWRCDWAVSSSQTPRLKSIAVEEYEEVISRSGHGTLFQDRTESVLGRVPSFQTQMRAGVDHWGSTLDRRLGLDFVALHGIAIGDADGDGLDDVFVCEPGGLPNRLYLHKEDGTARDVSAVAEVDYLDATRSALFLDLDNDGDQDLVIASERFVIFMANDGFGRFYQRSAFRTPSAVVSLAASDYDLDGDLDIYVCGYFTLEDAAEGTIGLGNPIPFHDANNGARNLLFRNEGEWKYVDVTKQVGLDQDNTRFSLAAAWEDYDSDGDPDLYVANDYGRNCLYRNDRGQFVNVAAEAGVEDISAGMSVSWGDYNQDGFPDIYVSNMFSSAGNRIAYQRQFKRDATSTTRDDYRRFARGNTLFENTGQGTFRDVTVPMGVTMGRWAWSSNFVDINNDGWEDLVVTNGMLTREDDNGDL